ncbi:Enoyl-CoA hydratase/carnithine racemase [Haloechinothrix alba]|uniref:Enoyl-CoA hydratase/carnithine racemase n=1 Tax=Haloechinothrix alba TaxID=664784 RepID=A0A238XDW1_9PSEU|nr:enoyl-CoA hydratase/isomerase family protein [Haloechinothrix alba]SNR57196.1 Enoyl-CoA hydratase/carnithine racemase [Haloechinothrix alba]
MPQPQRPRTVDVDISDGVATIRLNRPDRRNAVVPELVDDLLAALDAVDAADPTPGAVVLAGRGRAFCAGHDLKEPLPEGDSRARLERLQAVTRRIRNLRQPVLAAVHGYAIGAGAEFAIGCDLLLAARDAVFRFPEVGLGLSVTGAASRLLPALLGPLKAKELVLLGGDLDAPAAARLGMVSTVVEEAELLPTALRHASEIARNPVAAALAKRALDAGTDGTVDAALELEVSHAMITEASGEAALPAASNHDKGGHQP